MDKFFKTRMCPLFGGFTVFQCFKSKLAPSGVLLACVLLFSMAFFGSKSVTVTKDMSDNSGCIFIFLLETIRSNRQSIGSCFQYDGYKEKARIFFLNCLHLVGTLF